MKAQDKLLFDPALGLDFDVVVHGDQRFVHHRPIVAGDELTSTPYVDQVRVMAGNDVDHACAPRSPTRTATRCAPR